MKKRCLVLLILFCSLTILKAQTDKMYVYLKGGGIVTLPINNIDSMVFYPPVGLTSDSVIDLDGNVYRTVKIYSQVWLTKNLMTTKFNDGTAIPLVTNNTWGTLTTPAYCWYNNDSVTNKNPYGALYNWYAVDTKKLCPTGWRVASYDDYKTLVDTLGGASVAGGKLKETGTVHWGNPNYADNSTGFTAISGGLRIISDGSFASKGILKYLWTSTEYKPDRGEVYTLSNTSTSISNGTSEKQYGFSVRCIKE